MKKIHKKFIKPTLLCTILACTIGLTQAQDSSWKAPAEADKMENPTKGDPVALKAGKAMYNKFCAICHGPKGKGDGMAGMALKPKPANFTDKGLQAQTDGAIYWKLTEGKAPMASYKATLSDTERWQLVTFIRSLSK